ncbi:MAG: glycosyltransferase [Dehalococcoidales bacterium]|nr:glycosyltransferase [Dehalococcoidales bacterium]
MTLSKQPSHAIKTWRICVLFLPDLTAEVASTATLHVGNTLRLLEPLASEIFIITGNFPEDAISNDKVHLINIRIKAEDNTRSSMLLRVPKFLMLQLRMSLQVIRLAKRFEVLFLAAGAQVLFLPALVAKLLRKKIALIHLGVGASSRQDYEVMFEKTLFGAGRRLFPWLTELMERVSFRLADRIMVFLSHSDSPLLRKYTDKTYFGCSRFYVDIKAMKVERSLASREKLVGYIGRFIDMKGVMNFVKAIPLIISTSAETKVLIGGDGPQRQEIEQEIKDAGLENRVTLTGWIPHNNLSRYLNKMKLLVIPSYGEHGPHMVIEAMACGTPVLATSVGIVPDVIKDGETGFILENNSPESIAKDVIKALENQKLEEISRKARKLVEEEYTFELAVEKYREVLESL